MKAVRGPRLAEADRGPSLVEAGDRDQEDERGYRIDASLNLTEQYLRKLIRTFKKLLI